MGSLAWPRRRWGIQRKRFLIRLPLGSPSAIQLLAKFPVVSRGDERAPSDWQELTTSLLDNKIVEQPEKEKRRSALSASEPYGLCLNGHVIPIPPICFATAKSLSAVVSTGSRIEEVTFSGEGHLKHLYHNQGRPLHHRPG